MARLLDHYNTTVATELATKFGVTNKMAIPKLDKIVINMGVGRATQDKALIEAAVDSLTKIAGQKPMVTKAKTSVAGFRLREGNEIGCKVTLRGKRMYEFLDRLVSIALPRIRDFRGVNPNSFDGHGKLHPGTRRTGRLSRDRRRPAPAHPGDGHYDRHDVQERRPGPRTPPFLRHAVPGAQGQGRPQIIRPTDPIDRPNRPDATGPLVSHVDQSPDDQDRRPHASSRSSTATAASSAVDPAPSIASSASAGSASGTWPLAA